MAVPALRVEEILPYFRHPQARELQVAMFEAFVSSMRGLYEAPTGIGKTDVGMAILRALGARGEGPLFYVTPTKTQVDQVERFFERVIAKVLGRSEYPCLYYQETKPGTNAQESPCYMLKCPHRVNQETGKTEGEKVKPCPYLQAKYLALQGMRQGQPVVCTTAFFLTNRLMVGNWRELNPAMVVVDECHRLARVARGVFEYTMTDFHLQRVADIVEGLDDKQAKIIRKFRSSFMAIARKRPSRTRTLLKEEEIAKLLEIALTLDASTLEREVREAVDTGVIDPVEQSGELKLLENLVRGIPRMVSSFQYALSDGRYPLNYVVAFYYKKDDPEAKEPRRKARYYLTIKSYYVAPIIKRALGQNVFAYSATIGDADIFGFETGIRDLPFYRFPSPFSVEQTRVYMPADTPNLALKKRRRDDVKKALKMIANSGARFAEAGYRSLVVVVSELEREQFLKIAGRIGLEAISYGNGVRAKDAAARFLQGEGQVLVGTAAHYAEGIDLPRQTAPIIFFLRPGYPRPDDPEAQFEQRRFSEARCWALWNWRVMLEALQVRGRNQRTAEDIGVCIFVSQQFRNFLYHALPEWLKPAYRREITMGEVVEDTLALLGEK